jgi:hypothetical protein
MRVFHNPQRREARENASAPRRRSAHNLGLTLMETALTTIIVGLAITALVKLVLTNTQQNRWSQHVTTGTLLAENVREMVAGLPFSDSRQGTTTFGPESGEQLATYNDVDDFDGFDSLVRPDIPSGQPVGPVDAARRVITQTVGGVQEVPPEWRNWREQIAVDPVDPNNLNSVYPKPNTARTCVRVTVTISYQAPGSGFWEPAVQLRWLKTK